MKQTIIFISGFMVPKILAKTRFVWNHNLWKDYNRIYLSSKTPLSDAMVEKELVRLMDIVNSYPNPIVAGHSLGAWWAANLACRPEANIKKLIMWTPLGNTERYPFFNVSSFHHPHNKFANKNSVGSSIVFYAKNDFIVPPINHSSKLINLFGASSHELDGGHFFQKNHKMGLIFMKNWIEID